MATRMAVASFFLHRFGKTRIKPVKQEIQVTRAQSWTTSWIIEWVMRWRC
jgi:hypothetical protein